MDKALQQGVWRFEQEARFRILIRRKTAQKAREVNALCWRGSGFGGRIKNGLINVKLALTRIGFQGRADRFFVFDTGCDVTGGRLFYEDIFGFFRAWRTPAIMRLINAVAEAMTPTVLEGFDGG